MEILFCVRFLYYCKFLLQLKPVPPAALPIAYIYRSANEIGSESQNKKKKGGAGKKKHLSTFLKYELLILSAHLVFLQLSTESIKTFRSTIRIVIFRPNYLHNWNFEVLMNSSLYNAVHHKYGQERFRGLYSFLQHAELKMTSHFDKDCYV